MATLIEEVLTRLPQNLRQEMHKYANEHHIPVEQLMRQLLNQSSYSVTCLERMSVAYRWEVISSPQLMLELARLLWKRHWQQRNLDTENEMAI